jgi:hypothetical protein
MAVHRADQRGGKEKRCAICPRLGTSPQQARLPSVPHLLPIGFGTMGQRRSWQQASDFGPPHPGMVGDLIPEWSARPPKAEPRQQRRTGAPHVARGVRGLKGQRDSRATHRQPNHHCQIKSWLSRERAANEGVVHEGGGLMVRAPPRAVRGWGRRTDVN